MSRSARNGVEFCLADTMPEERVALREFPGAIGVHQGLPSACPGPVNPRMYFTRHARVCSPSGNSDYSDYYYEMSTPIAGANLPLLNSLSRSLFKLKIAFAVLALFVAFSIGAFVLLNPSVSPFLTGRQQWCVPCKDVEDVCGETDVLKDLTQHGNLLTCCFTKFQHIVSLIAQCNHTQMKVSTVKHKQ